VHKSHFPKLHRAKRDWKNCYSTISYKSSTYKKFPVCNQYYGAKHTERNLTQQKVELTEKINKPQEEGLEGR
jgi:hypothetical protein